MKEINFSEARRGHSSAVIISASEFMGGKLPKWTKSLPI